VRREIGLIGATAIAARAMIGPSRRVGGARVRAVAASDRTRAEAFAAEHDLPVAHPSYEALLDDGAIDTVYISVHNSAHAEWAAAAARAGKHVVVEKPLCLSERELEQIQAAATGVHVTEAVMTAGHPWQAEVRRLIGSRELGELTGVISRIAFDAKDRTGYRFRRDLGGGAFFDTASYWLQAVQATVGLDGAQASGTASFAGGVDTEFHAALEWPSGVRATLACALNDGYAADHEFVFTGGRVRLRNFLRPAAGDFPVNLIVAPDDAPRTVQSFPAGNYYDEQLRRILALLATPAPSGELADTAARIALMAAAYADGVP
jgi:predicted dehydrogenase